MTSQIYQYGKGDNIAGDKVGRDKIGTQINSSPAAKSKAASTAAESLFISYARKDAAPAAQRLRTELISAGFTVWQDIEDMQGGKAWKAQLRKALKEVDAVIILLTPAAVTSKYVEWESEIAQAFETPILPVKVKDCKLPEALDHLHCQDLSNEATYSNTLMKILKDLRSIKE